MANTFVKVDFFRHGESIANINPDIIVGRSNLSPLTEAGVSHALRVGRVLAEQCILPDFVYSSPAQRTIQTATHVLNAMKLSIDPVINPDLQELDMGTWSGQPESEVMTPGVVAAMEAKGVDFAPPSGESMKAVGLRMQRWLDTLVDHDGAAEKRIFAFTHGHALRSLFTHIMQLDYEGSQTIHIPKLSRSQVVLEDEGWKVISTGDVVAE